MKKNIKGFTLVELLVVIAIIGILAALSVTSFTTSQRQARDTQRKSDLSQYRTVLESFANANNGLFPYSNGVVDMDVICTNYLTNYTSSCPVDPRVSIGVWGKYSYWTSDGSGNAGDPTATKYLIYVNGGMETDSTKDWVVCSSGKSGSVVKDWATIVAFCQ